MLALLSVFAPIGVVLWFAWENHALQRTLSERTLERDAALRALEEFAHLTMSFHHDRHGFDTITHAFVAGADETRH